MDWKLELIVVPVSDVDRAKAFYVDQAGFVLDVDFSAGDDFRVVQLTPPGSACSIALMRNTQAPGSLQGLRLVVTDIDAARAEPVGRGVDASEVFHFAEGGRLPGHAPDRIDYGTFLSFSDPDGNGWLVQEVGYALGRVDGLTRCCSIRRCLPFPRPRGWRDATPRPSDGGSAKANSGRPRSALSMSSTSAIWPTSSSRPVTPCRSRLSGGAHSGVARCPTSSRSSGSSDRNVEPTPARARRQRGRVHRDDG